MQIKITTHVNAHYLNIAAQFDQKLFEALAPPFPRLEVQRFDGCAKGNEVWIVLNAFGIKVRWDALIVENGQNQEVWYFIDEGTRLPFPLRSWKHQHRIEKIDDSNSKIIDDIEYSSGWILLDYLLFLPLYWQFAMRKPIYKKFFKKNE
jgi:ligand-binding SRPBCC domain-containing protein